jgi:hypothetical protein
MSQIDELMEEDRYLGDGLYAKFDGYQVELYSSNGIHKTNQVFLEPSVIDAFERYLSDLKQAIASPVPT